MKNPAPVQEAPPVIAKVRPAPMTYAQGLRRMLGMFAWFRRLGVKPTFFVLSILFSCAMIFFNLLGLRLFMQLLQELIKGDFAGVKDKMGITRHLLKAF